MSWIRGYDFSEVMPDGGRDDQRGSDHRNEPDEEFGSRIMIADIRARSAVRTAGYEISMISI